MAKEGIDSFLLNCHTNENLSEIEAAYGIKGFAVIVRLWQKIYSEKGYYCEWTERSPLLFLSTWFGGGSGVELNLINEVVGTALRNGIFDADLYDKYHILTSDGIQTRYFEVVKRRASVEVIDEYLLVSVDNLRGNVCRKSILEAWEMVRRAISNSNYNSDKEYEKLPGVTATELIEQQGFGQELEQAMKEWFKYKIEKRQGYGETGFRTLLTQVRNKVASHGEAAVVEVIRISMSNNWQGIIWDRIGSGSRYGQDRISNRVSEVDSW